MRASRRHLAALAVAGLLAGCGGGAATTAGAPVSTAADAGDTSLDRTYGSSGGTTSDATAPPTAAADATGVPEALQFTGTTLAGAEFDGASVAGGDVLLWFWAPW